MRQSVHFLIATLCLSACTGLAAEAPQKSGGSLGWLSGCWQHVNGSTREAWSDSYDGLLFGHSVTLRDGRLVAFEDIRIVPSNDRATYVVHVNGAPGVAFAETERSQDSITFENPDHDFPQRIRYERAGTDLTATISLLSGEQTIPIAMKQCV